MAKEFFAYPETKALFNTLEQIRQRSNVSRGKAFEDIIHATVSSLAAETMENNYFRAIDAHTKGTKGKRGVDLFPMFFAQTVEAMTERDHDVLGDLFEGAISYGENSLYRTPEPVAGLMARMTLQKPNENSEGKNQTITDCCCGTGILLMEAGKINPRAELCGQDIDARCASIAAINIGLRGKYGWIICGNTLTREVQFVYRIGSFFHETPNGRRRGVIREVPPEQCPVLPELQNRTRQRLFDTLEDDKESELPKPLDFTIIEIPDWVLRLEQQTIAMDEADNSPGASAENCPAPEDSNDDDVDDESPPTQKNLF